MFLRGDGQGDKLNILNCSAVSVDTDALAASSTTLSKALPSVTVFPQLPNADIAIDGRIETRFTSDYGIRHPMVEKEVKTMEVDNGTN